ncbi:MAG: flagellar basal body-associated FliL family protein [Acidobacteriota bacterium]|nr:flagellar basal body-associated FliL family protein [Acidobacteriota bacterium]
MAWEEESIESGVDFEEVGGKNSKLKLIIIIVGVLAILAAAYFAYTKFFAGEDEPAEGEEGTAQVDGGGAEEEAPPPDTPGFPVKLDKFTLNLSGSATPHYLVTTISLEVTTQELKTAIEDPNDQFLYTIKTRDAILEILRGKSYEEVKDPATSVELKKEIKFRLDRIYREGKVKSVYFDQFLID